MPTLIQFDDHHAVSTFPIDSEVVLIANENVLFPID